MLISSNITVWYVGVVIGGAVVVVAVIIVAVILGLASRIAQQARMADDAVATISEQSSSLNKGVDQILDSGVRILHTARALRKAAVGK